MSEKAKRITDFLGDVAHVNSPIGGAWAVITIGDLKDIAVILSVLVGALCTVAITIYKIKTGKLDDK